MNGVLSGLRAACLLDAQAVEDGENTRFVELPEADTREDYLDHGDVHRHRDIEPFPAAARFGNPYADVRYTSCPQCGEKTRQRKLPLVIHVDPAEIVTINKTCRFCPKDDLLIAHQDELESVLAAYFSQAKPEAVGNEYLVLGTMDRPVWRQGMQTPPATGDIRELLHDFRDYVTFRPAPRWGPA